MNIASLNNFVSAVQSVTPDLNAAAIGTGITKGKVIGTIVVVVSIALALFIWLLSKQKSCSGNLFEFMQKYTDKQYKIRKKLKENPKNIKLLVKYGWSFNLESKGLAREGKLVEQERLLGKAERQFKKALAIDPTSINALEGYGCCLRFQGKEEEAKIQLAKAQQYEDAKKTES